MSVQRVISRVAAVVLAYFIIDGTATQGAGTDFNGDTRAAVVELQHYYDRHGLWHTVGWWNAANCVDALENDIVANNDTNYLGTIQYTFRRNSGGNFITGAYDDEGWWAEAWNGAYDLTGNVAYLNMAKTIFADLTNAWDGHCGGGLWWSSDRTYKNAIPNELFLLLAARLHQRTPGDGGPGSYYDWATNEWSWFKNSGMINNQNLINDGLTRGCQNNGQTTWTYNQGVVIGGLTELYKITGDTNCLAEAETIANATIASLTSANGVLEEPGGGDGPDAPEFKGIFARNLACLYDEDRQPAYYNFLLVNARSIWSNDRNDSDQLGLQWTGPFDSADAGRQTSAIMPLSVLAEPVTSLLPFARGSGDPAFNHSVGVAAGTLAWSCGPSTPAGMMQYGPYLTSLAAGEHTVHFRLAVNALNTSASNLVSLTVAQNGTPLTRANVPWNAFTRANQPQDFALGFTNTEGALEFLVHWNQTVGAPTLNLSDVTIDGGHNWVAANLGHDIGRLDGRNAWEADPVRDRASGYLTRGPGTDELGSGECSASFELKVDNFNWDQSEVAVLSIVESATGKAIASRSVRRNEFPNTRYQTFTLDFKADAGKRYDFRTWWHYSPHAPRLTQRSVVVELKQASDRSPAISFRPGG